MYIITYAVQTAFSGGAAGFLYSGDSGKSYNFRAIRDGLWFSDMSQDALDSLRHSAKPFEIPQDEARTLVDTCRAMTLPPISENLSYGLDGTTFTIFFSYFRYGAMYNWWDLFL